LGVIALCLAVRCWSAPVVPAPVSPDITIEPRATRSQSQQFVVQGLPMGPAPAQHAPNSQSPYVRVDPTLLAVSCERIKQAILAELGWKDEWMGTIFVNVHPTEQFDQPIDITTIRHRTGWSYRVDMPDQVERSRLIRAIVQVVMREIVNRGAKNRPAELPPWLMEGMAAYLQATTLSTFTLEPESWTIRQRENYNDSAQQVRELLKSRTPLTFEELSWPTEEHLDGPESEVYRACSQYFVGELLRMKNGRPRFCDFLRGLPEFMNWQTAFLRAYQGQFDRLLDVDKWWSLEVAQLNSRNLMSTWTPDEAFRQLDDALVVPAEVRLQARELPVNTAVKLQQILMEWPANRQNPILQQKISVLNILHFRAPPDLTGLIDNYRITLDTLLKDRQSRGQGPFASNPFSKDKVVVEETIKRLDQLDAQRDNLRYLANHRPGPSPGTPLENTGPVVNPREMRK
jgi:hypothetical protein